MAATIIVSGEQHEVEVTGQDVLDAIQDLGIEFSAPCGGNGTCGKCQVLVHDEEEGLRYVLACRTRLEDGMEVHLEMLQPMTIQTAGAGHEYVVDGGRTGYGVAIDVGTTTMVCRLHDLATGELLASAARPNPQAVFGADVIARIKASMEGQLNEMCDLLRNSLDDMIGSLCKKARIDRSDVGDIAVVGNTVIEHLATRLSPNTIGVSPYKPLSLFGGDFEFEPVGEKAYFAPAVSGYVGGDITAGILASDMQKAEAVQVYLDLGTNGELALGSKDRMTCCATAAGPVFEGATIHFGMPAQKGAISTVAVEGDGLKLSVIGDAEPVGICGTGIIDAVAVMLEVGAVDETGRLLSADEVGEPWSAFIGRNESGNVFYLDEARAVYISQKDVRNVQLAKAGICGGILTLLEDFGLSFPEVGGLVIAGGFGSYLNIASAARIGLFPSELQDRASSVGNMAAEGASMLLLSKQARETVQEIASGCNYIELSVSASFNNRYYMECMAFE